MTLFSPSKQKLVLHLHIRCVLRSLLILHQHLVQVITCVTFVILHIISILIIIVIQVSIRQNVRRDGLFLLVLSDLLLFGFLIAQKLGRLIFIFTLLHLSFLTLLRLSVLFFNCKIS